jgi:hypothetical protein
VTFAQLVQLAPELQVLFDDARSHHSNWGPDFCANAVWYGYPGHKPGIKKRMGQLVGWGAPEDAGELRTSAAYDVAYETIYQALPDCRGDCSCLKVSRALGVPV